MVLSQALQRKRCLICSRSGRSLCHEHEKLYVLDVENGWYRKKQRLQRDVRKRENKRKFHKTEDKLIEILKLIFGRENVVTSVHPLWAFSNKNVLLEYDVGITSKKILVEYDGIQHYEFPNYFHKTRRDFEAQVARDRLKDELAKDNGWNLVRVKYTEDVTYGSIFTKFKQRGVQ